MRVAAEIGQHLFRAAEGWFGIDDPLDLPQLIELAGEGGGFGERREFPEEAELACRERRVELGEEQPAEEAREHAHRQEEARGQATKRVPSSDGQPPGTTQWTCG